METNSARFAVVANMAVIFAVPKFQPPTASRNLRLGFMYRRSVNRSYLQNRKQTTCIKICAWIQIFAQMVVLLSLNIGGIAIVTCGIYRVIKHVLYNL